MIAFADFIIELLVVIVVCIVALFVLGVGLVLYAILDVMAGLVSWFVERKTRREAQTPPR